MQYLITLLVISLSLACFSAMAKEQDATKPPAISTDAEIQASYSKSRKKYKKPKALPKSADKTVRQQGSRVIEEYRVKGRLTMVKVISKKAKPYFIYYDENWNSKPGSDDLDDTPKTPYWKIFSW